MTQEVVKVTASCRLFCAFSICDSLERQRCCQDPSVCNACCPCLPSFLSEGISNCFKILEAALFLLQHSIVWQHLEHERLSNFSNFCKTKTCWPISEKQQGYTIFRLKSHYFHFRFRLCKKNISRGGKCKSLIVVLFPLDQINTDFFWPPKCVIFVKLKKFK